MYAGNDRMKARPGIAEVAAGFPFGMKSSTNKMGPAKSGDRIPSKWESLTEKSFCVGSNRENKNNHKKRQDVNQRLSPRRDRVRGST